MSKITIQDFAIRLAERKNISVADAQRFMTAMLDIINEGLNIDKVVKIKGLGTFKVIDVKQRKSIDVNTGEEIIIEGRGKITFTPDAIMRDLVNKPFSQFETVLLNDGVDFSEMESPSNEDEEVVETKEVAEVEEPQETSPQEEVIPKEIEEKPQEDIETQKDDATGCVSEESFSEALLVLDYINGKELPKEEPKEEVEDNPLDATDEAISDALFVLNTLDDGNAEVPVVTETTDEPVEEEPVAAQEIPVQPLMETSKEETEDEVPSVDAQDVEDKTHEETDVTERITEEPKAVVVEDDENSDAWKRWLIAIVLVGIVGFLSYYCINYFYNKENLAKEEINSNNTVVAEKSPANVTVADSVALSDSLNRIKREKEIEDSIAALALKEKQENTKPKVIVQQQNTQTEKQAPAKQQTTTQSSNKELEYAKRLVQYGAYNIVGTDQVITVKKGQTMTSVAKAYLGKDMACYIEVHNGTTTLIEGQKLKIPKLQTKKKSKR